MGKLEALPEGWEEALKAATMAQVKFVADTITTGLAEVEERSETMKEAQRFAILAFFNHLIESEVAVPAECASLPSYPRAIWQIGAVKFGDANCDGIIIRL